MDEEVLDSLAAASIKALKIARRWEELQVSHHQENKPMGSLAILWDRKIEVSRKIMNAIDAEIYRRNLYGY